jgi:hypothetical protein
MERPAPCFEWPLKKQIQRLIIRRTFRECICHASGNFSKPRSGLGMAGAKQRHMGPLPEEAASSLSSLETENLNLETYLKP